ncbi:MAG: GGDEF domain-containing protein [Roseateles depolymerans]|uniref:diguanylate cyclase n=1 Tax=Roseateles depolymerans TaxID=76731 RepID=A0A2W5FJB5_9BURK|nr:MAG: GGDEF domain-containing protein [Roseateles depolymerans]
MRLTRLFLLTTGLLLGLVTALLLRSVWADRQRVVTAELGLAAMERAYLTMTVAEKASAERGPTIPVLNDTEPASPELHARLANFRQATDAAFDAALNALREAEDAASAAALADLEQARVELAAARREVDRVAALPHASRSAPGQRLTRGPIDQLFAVIDTVLGSATLLSAAAEAIYPALAVPLVGARYAAEMREYAGRLGSQFTTALATGQPLAELERREIPELIGRIEQLRKLIALQLRVGKQDATLHAALDGLETRYFAVSLPFARRQAELGQSGPLGVDSAAFVARYVPPMKSIVELRDAMFESARRSAARELADTRQRLVVNTALGVAVLCVEIAVFLLIRHRVLLPLLRSTRVMNAIMAGEIPDEPPPVNRRDEVGDMKRAVAALREATLRRRTLEREREQLFEQLRIASDTDFLTGLPNRRAFAVRATELLAQARRQGWPMALLVFDLDHFKRVNDLHGHQAGDQVLREAAERARSQVRRGELLARLGGEEFVVLATDCRPEQAAQLAERLRATLADTSMPVGNQSLQVTASFGLACAEARDVSDLDALFREADRALYRAKELGRNRVCGAEGPRALEPSA